MPAHAETSPKHKWDFSPNPYAVVLNIGIVGAGIAGLTAAAALARMGHNIEVFERSHFKAEVGAALGVGPNATGILDAIGFDYDGSGSLSIERQQVYDASTLKRLFDFDSTDIVPKYGSKWFAMHRVNLHRELQSLTLHPRGCGTPASIRLGSPVTSVDCEEGIVTFADGSQVQKDVILGADGIHSKVAASILGEDLPPIQYSGQSAYRWLVPTEKVFANEATASFFERSECIIKVPTIDERRIISYPCDAFKSFNFLLLHHTLVDTSAEDDSWQAHGNVSDLLALCHGFHPTLQQACSMAEGLKLWKLYFRKPLPKWSRGKAVLIGDAAHPMLPHQAQAANMALEDVGAVARLLSNLRSKDDVPARLSLVHKIRGKRASSLQIFSNSPQDRPGDVENDIRPYFDGPLPKNPLEFREYLFGYDLLQHVDEVMREEGIL